MSQSSDPIRERARVSDAEDNIIHEMLFDLSDRVGNMEIARAEEKGAARVWNAIWLGAAGIIGAAANHVLEKIL
jgi:hypothetical protein